MRLIGLLIAAMLAFAEIILIAAPQAAASIGLDLPLISHSEHGHTNHVQDGVRHDHAAAQRDCGDYSSDPQGSGGTGCCNMGACHAVQLAADPMVHSPIVAAASMAVLWDEQVNGIIPVGFDRPPRTV